ncbi:hypothetical protein [Dyella sp. ASV21]|uniref:hypothetical protein n=1 Tax=Dyella sp. ASV21 TaxID=2795114 RepID=UPI0018ED5F51|nr:hypothetical protein [Dyella sp. ASV21]
MKACTRTSGRRAFNTRGLILAAITAAGVLAVVMVIEGIDASLPMMTSEPNLTP